MATDIHTSTSADIHETQSGGGEPPRNWREGEAFRNLEAIRPYVSWLVMAVMAVVTLYVSLHDANAEQINAIKELKDRTTTIETQIITKGAARDKQLETMRSDMVDKDLFNERTNNLQKQLDAIQQSLNDIQRRMPN